MSKQSKIPAAELAIFCQEMYQLVQSGLPIADGLNMLLEDETDRRTKAWLAPLCAHAEEGMPLAQAMRQTEAFPDYMTDMVALVVLLVPALRARVTGFVRFHLGGARCVWPDCGSTFRVCDVDGGSTAQALSESGLFSARDGRLLALPERTGSMAETLEQVADTLRRIDGYIGAIEPTIVILTALLAGVILLSVMLPLMSVMSTIG